MRRIAKDFLKGLVIVVPAVTTIYLVLLPVQFFDELIGAPFPGIGLALTAAGIWAVGVLASNRIGARIFRRLVRMIESVPVLKLLHQTARDLVEAFAGEERKFDRPVVVDLLPGQDIKLLGFITRSTLDAPGLEDRVAVYCPQSYNIAGNLLVVPRDRVTPLEVDPGRFMTLIVSGGVTGGEGPEAAVDED